MTYQANSAKAHYEPDKIEVTMETLQSMKIGDTIVSEGYAVAFKNIYTFTRISQWYFTLVEYYCEFGTDTEWEGITIFQLTDNDILLLNARRD